MINIQDNYLSDADHQTLYKAITADIFPWFFNSYIVSKLQDANLETFQFTHVFYKESQITSSSFMLLKPILIKLNYKSLVRIKINLNPYSQKIIEGGFHPDQDFKCKAAIYYLNTNNGYTLFKEGNEKVKSVKNRMVFFDTLTHHLGTNSTDCKNRLVLNFNYFK